MVYISFLLCAILFVLLLACWKLEGISDTLKSIDSKVDAVEDVNENSGLLIKLQTEQVRFNGEFFEDV